VCAHVRACTVDARLCTQQNCFVPLVLILICMSQSGVQVLNLIQELLPHVAALNLLSSNMHQSTGSIDSVGGQDSQGYLQPSTTSTTSHHYAWVESDHPYKPATVSNYRSVWL
jgi:E3 ubiquitin-protein ligase MYCBP2